MGVRVRVRVTSTVRVRVRVRARARVRVSARSSGCSPAARLAASARSCTHTGATQL